MLWFTCGNRHQYKSNLTVKVHKDSMRASDRASALGWDKSQIKVLDGDLGKSGQTTIGREDFHQLMAAVGLGEVGAVFALEASRFSRSLRRLA